MNGAFKQSTPNAISFATFVDPTPHPARTSARRRRASATWSARRRTRRPHGGAGRRYGPDNPGTRPECGERVHIFSGLTEQPLQTIVSPDQQPGAAFGTRGRGPGRPSTATASAISRSAPAPLTSAPTRTRAGSTSSAATPSAPGGDRAAGAAVVVARPRRRRRAGARGAGARARAGTVPPPVAIAAGGRAATSLAGRRLSLAASRTRAPRRAPVRLRGRLRAFADPAGCQRRQAVRIERRARRSAALPRDRFPHHGPAGAYSLTVRPAGTGAYRARVDRTAACLAATSAVARVFITVRARRP